MSSPSDTGKFPARFNELSWYRTNVPCMEACPVHTDSEQNRGRVGQTRCLDDQPLERGNGPALILVEQIAQRLHEIVAHGATHTAIPQQKGLLIDLLHEMVIQPHFAEFVDEHRRAPGLSPG